MTAAAAPKLPRRLACACCEAEIECGLSAGCWCAAEPYRLPVTKAWLEDCLCPECLRKRAAALAESHRAASDGWLPRSARPRKV